jgi:hypothetical protein
MQTQGTHGLPSLVSTSPEASQRFVGRVLTTLVDANQEPEVGNAIAAWFKSINGASASHAFLQNWIGLPGQRFDGAHGVKPASIGKYLFHNENGTMKVLPTAGHWPHPNGSGANTVTALAMAEFWKRVMLNSLDPITWLKAAPYGQGILSPSARKTTFFSNQANYALTDDDLRVFFYGNPSGGGLGGMALAAMQLKEFVDPWGGNQYLDSISEGQWRLYGKLGYGDSRPRNRSESVLGGVFCLPANPHRSVYPEGRLIAFHLNAQAVDEKRSWALLLNGIEATSKTMLPLLKKIEPLPPPRPVLRQIPDDGPTESSEIDNEPIHSP